MTELKPLSAEALAGRIEKVIEEFGLEFGPEFTFGHLLGAFALLQTVHGYRYGELAREHFKESK